MSKKLLIALVFPVIASCAGQPMRADNMAAAGQMGPGLLSGIENAYAAGDYRINALDLLQISVFQIADLSFPELRVDAAGRIEMPLIGSVNAAGRTPSELSAEIRRLLLDRYLQNPQVTVIVKEASSQKVTVDGAVTEPGVYEMTGRTTLLQAVAMAKGPTRISDLRNVAVFRNVDGQRMAAVFDLAAIRAGQLPDPVLQGDDIVVVDTSQLNSVMRDIVSALPALAVFRAY